MKLRGYTLYNHSAGKDIITLCCCTDQYLIQHTTAGHKEAMSIGYKFSIGRRVISVSVQKLIR
ncbi:hypothetical protein [Bacteroides faecichinchillae]|uniref:hypothetical protein n=1 Tax=Bacteroides faecichinchillae TaxID=871325 RepID=UPI00111483D4|nr:hypothetical protein [Bacteroides faecichinchillae]